MEPTTEKKIMSTEMIKPSVPTPKNRKHFKCSFLDQLAPTHYLPFILLYNNVVDNQQAATDHSEIIQHLKTTLSETLTQFYMASGMLTDDGFSIDCDDKGVLFVDAKMNCNVSEFIKGADYRSLNQCLPDYDSYSHHHYGDRQILVAFQFNIFKCGGIGIAMCFSHKLGDGYSAINFLKAWAATSSSSKDTIFRQPEFDAAALLFPATDVTKYKPVIEAPSEPDLIAKKFIFSESSIAKLKETACIDSSTDFEIISAFIMKRVMATKETKRLFASLYYVNLRDKMNPPLPPEDSFGNFWRLGLAPPSMLDNEGYDNLISKQRNAINAICNEDYIKNLQKGKDQRMEIFLWGIQKSPESNKIDIFIFTSWLDFPNPYELDFGFGKPAYVCSPSRPRRNMVTLMNTKEGDGIEVWVNMVEDDMAAFESDSELLSMTTR